MPSGVKSAKHDSSLESPKNQDPAPWFRETVESFAVALILAFLFRAFVAEAFVIPTGSMAPTLMGAHKDVTCPECGFGYQCGASSEFDNSTGRRLSERVIATACPLCRHELKLDLEGNPNHATFSGDRILVSKFAYTYAEPKRWDVIVFKYPNDARLNYIKRLVGRPQETLRIQHGDIYVDNLATSEKQFEIARKPPNVIGAMLQPLYDSSHLPKSLVQAGLPSAWQPLSKPEDSRSESNRDLGVSSWQVDQTTDRWQAACDALVANADKPEGNKIHWLRYFHRVIDPKVWNHVLDKGSFPAPIEPYSSRLVTDFTHYNSSQHQSQRNSKSLDFDNDGLHWVGDLASEFQIEVQEGQGRIILDLIEMGVHHYCSIDVQSGQATLTTLKDKRQVSAIDDGQGGVTNQAVASTSVRGKGKYRLRYANIDDQLVLWVGRKVQNFSPSNRIVSQQYVGPSERYPHWTQEDPLDAAPAGIGIVGLKARISRARVWRDVYYIAPQNNFYIDYRNRDDAFERSIVGENVARYHTSIDPNRKFALDQRGRLVDFRISGEERWSMQRDALYGSPELWINVPAFADRQAADFRLDEDQYFPMGDNSPQSLDARSWGFAPERLLIGRAVLVFWPHYWNRPIPFLPNIQRIGLIR